MVFFTCLSTILPTGEHFILYVEVLLLLLLLLLSLLLLFYPPYEVYRGCIVFAYSVIMFVCRSVCLSVCLSVC